jgi:hypothetical protein
MSVAIFITGPLCVFHKEDIVLFKEENMGTAMESIQVSEVGGLEIPVSLALCIATKLNKCRRDEYDMVLQYLLGDKLQGMKRVEALRICSRHIAGLIGVSQTELQDSISRQFESISNVAVQDDRKSMVRKDGEQSDMVFSDWVHFQRTRLELAEMILVPPITD